MRFQRKNGVWIPSQSTFAVKLPQHEFSHAFECVFLTQDSENTEMSQGRSTERPKFKIQQIPTFKFAKHERREVDFRLCRAHFHHSFSQNWFFHRIWEQGLTFGHVRERTEFGFKTSLFAQEKCLLLAECVLIHLELSELIGTEEDALGETKRTETIQHEKSAKSDRIFPFQFLFPIVRSSMFSFCASCSQLFLSFQMPKSFCKQTLSRDCENRKWFSNLDE